MQTWQSQEAKNKFEEVIDDALTKGPQLITRRDREAVVMLAYSEYQRLTGADESLYEFFRRSPLVGVKLDLSRGESSIPDRFVP